MFTGLVEEAGEVLSYEKTPAGICLSVRASFASEVELGDSVAVNGCCLTVAAAGNGSLRFDLLEETARCTNLASMQAGGRVNLERSLAAGARLGGHFVSGHVDTTAPILTWQASGADWRLEVALAPEQRPYVVAKGCIAVDGISLTIADFSDSRIGFWIIPTTLEKTALPARCVGDRINLEFDLLAKYVERMMQVRQQAI